MRITLVLIPLAALAACARFDHVGRAPDFTDKAETAEHSAMLTPGLPARLEPVRAVDGSSLWNGNRQSLLGDRRALERGDILTVVIEIDDKAEISNDTDRARSASDSLGVPQLFGLPQRLNAQLPDGASLGNAVSIDSASSSSGSGSVKRNEKLTLRVAATVLDVLPNGVLS